MDIQVSKRNRKDDFMEAYKQLCALQSSCPLSAITARLDEDLIDCNADRFHLDDWTPILDALKCRNCLKLIAFRSFWKPKADFTHGIYLLHYIFKFYKLFCYNKDEMMFQGPAIVNSSLCFALGLVITIWRQIFLHLNDPAYTHSMGT